MITITFHILDHLLSLRNLCKRAKYISVCISIFYLYLWSTLQATHTLHKSCVIWCHDPVIDHATPTEPELVSEAFLSILFVRNICSVVYL